MSSRLVLPEPTQAPTEAEPRERDDALGDSEEPPEGYYAFVESPNATPPRYVALNVLHFINMNIIRSPCEAWSVLHATSMSHHKVGDARV